MLHHETGNERQSFAEPTTQERASEIAMKHIKPSFKTICPLGVILSFQSLSNPLLTKLHD